MLTSFPAVVAVLLSMEYIRSRQGSARHTTPRSRLRAHISVSLSWLLEAVAHVPPRSMNAQHTTVAVVPLKHLCQNARIGFVLCLLCCALPSIQLCLTPSVARPWTLLASLDDVERALCPKWAMCI